MWKRRVKKLAKNLTFKIWNHGIQSYHVMVNRWEGNVNSDRLDFLGYQNTEDGDWSHEIKRRLLLGRKALTNPDSILKKQRHHFADKGSYSRSYSFSSSQVQFWELVCKDGWALKNWGFWTVVLEKTLESLLVCKEIKPDNPKGNQPWIFIGKTDAEAKVLILWPPDVKSQLIRKTPDVWKDWGQKEKGATGDEIVWWHHWLNG